MTTVTESIHYGDAILSVDGNSIESVTVASGQNLVACQVVQKTHSLTAAKLTMAAGSNTGNGTLTLAKAGPEVKLGTYTVTCTTAVADGGVFSVTDPDSLALPTLTLTVGAGGATWYKHPQIEFIVTDSSVNFAQNDSFTIVVSATTTPVVVGTGNGTCTNVAFGPYARPGNYYLRCTIAVAHGGVFELTGPDSRLIAVFGMGTTTGAAMNYLDRREEISFTLTDNTDFVAGDYFAIAAVKAATYDYYTAWTVSTDSHRDLAVLVDAVDATSAAKAGVAVVRNAEVAATTLQWSGSPTAGSKSVAYEVLNRQGIAVRS